MSDQNPDRFLSSGSDTPDASSVAQTGLAEAAVASQLQTLLDLDQILSAAKLAERTVWVCLDGPLLAEHAQVRLELSELVDADGNVVSDADEETFIGLRNRAQELANRERDLHQQIVRKRIPFRFRAIDSDAWEQHDKSHRDQQRNIKDQRRYENETISKSAISPPMDVPGVERLRKGVNQAQFVAIFNGAFYVNNVDGVDVPFSPSSSGAPRQ